MLHEVHISNFRCFADSTLTGLRRVNVIVGPNGAGKTALMEAIFLAAGASPELAMRIKASRGLNTFAIVNTRAGYEALWRDLFSDFDQDKVIQIALKGLDDRNYNRTLNISYRKEETLVIPFPGAGHANEPSTSTILPITFEWELGSGKRVTLKPEIRPDGIAFQTTIPLEPLPVSFYSSAAIPTQEENARYFSALSIQNREESIVSALRSEFDYINGLSVQIWGGAPTVFASVKNVAEKVPVNLISSGITKLLSILLGIANQRSGIVCIDELENGFYFDRLPSIWSLILKFAKDFDVQIFASTHSWECLEAVAKCASADNEQEFAMLQAHSAFPNTGFKIHTGTALTAAISQKIEVR